MWGAHLDPDLLRQDLLILYLWLYMCVPACVCYSFIYIFIYVHVILLYYGIYVIFIIHKTLGEYFYLCPISNEDHKYSIP